MLDSYKTEKLHDTYMELRTNEDRPKWVAEAGKSLPSIIYSYDKNMVIHGEKAVQIMRDTLEKMKKYIPDKSSSMDVFEALMSGRYDSKIAICESREFINNCVESYIVNKSLYMLQVLTADEFDRKSPTQYTKKLDWIFDNFDYIFIKLIDKEMTNNG